MVQRHSISCRVNCTVSTLNCFRVCWWVFARSNRNIRGIAMSPWVENVCKVSASNDSLGTKLDIHGQRLGGPCTSTELVRTVSSRKHATLSVSYNDLPRPDPVYSVSSDSRLGRTARISGIALLGAPLSLNVFSLGKWERTKTSNVGPTPAHR